MVVVKQTIDLIIGPLTHIMNLSLSSGIVPEQMKVARVIPLLKAGILSLLANYRPVSVLPAFSKFLERIVYKSLDSFLFKYRILSCNQEPGLFCALLCSGLIKKMCFSASRISLISRCE